MLPVTLLAGPVPAYNLLIIAAPALSAFTAFCLCMQICRDFVAALIGGYIFGIFSI